METSRSSHAFDEAVALRPEGDDSFTGGTSAAYANMVGPFGGLIGATLLNAILSHPKRLGEPVSLTVHYAAPIADGGFTVKTRTMRTNRSTQHWIVELLQGEEVVVFASAMTARRRDTWAATDLAFPSVPAAEQVELSSTASFPPWTRRYEMRFIDGGPDVPFDEGHPSQTRLWVRDQPSRPMDFLSLAAICDVFFPRIIVRRPPFVPAGTVALTSYFHADAAQLAELGTEPVLGVARAQHFGKGFFDQSAEIWSAAGDLLASSHQMVYFKE